MEGLAFLLDLLNRLHLVTLMLPEQSTLVTDLLHIHQTHHLQRFLMDQTQLLFDLGGRLPLGTLQQLSLLRMIAAILSLFLLVTLLQPPRRYDLVDDLLFRLVPMGVLLLLNLGDLQRLLLRRVVMLLDVDQLDKRDILGKLGDVIGLEIDDDVVLGTLESVLVVLFDEERIETALTVRVAAGSQQARHVVAAVLAVTQRAFQVALHN